MWWNILPPIVIISVSLGLPHLMAPISNWFLVGNFFRRSLLDRDLRAQYMRDYRLTGNPYKLTNLDEIPDKSEEDDEKALEEKEYERCKTLVEERALQEALDRTVKCPKLAETEMTQEEEALEKCQRQKVKKKKKKAKKDENIVVEPVSKEEKCRKEGSLCDLSDPNAPPPPGEGTVTIDETATAVDEVSEAPKKCKKAGDDVVADGGDEVDGADVAGVKKCKDKKPSAVVVSDTPPEAPAEEDTSTVVVTPPEEIQDSQDTSSVVAGEGPKKCKTANVVGVETSKKCKKKQLNVVDSSTVQANEEETQQSQDSSSVVASDGPKKCKTANVDGIDTSKKCKKKKSIAADSSTDQVNEDENKHVVVVVDEGKKKSKCRKGDGVLDEGTKKCRSKESAEK